MYLHDCLRGRKERRLPIIVAVNLTALEFVNAQRHERTYTDNISAHGARVRSTYPWQVGEEVEITPANGETPVCGEVSIARASTMTAFSLVSVSGKAASLGPF
jgi:hypothetical protein